MLSLSLKISLTQKLETETPILSKKILKQNGVVFDKPKVEDYFEGVLDACF